jgi:hypothetical protein
MDRVRADSTNPCVAAGAIVSVSGVSARLADRAGAIGIASPRSSRRSAYSKPSDGLACWSRSERCVLTESSAVPVPGSAASSALERAERQRSPDWGRSTHPRPAVSRARTLSDAWVNAGRIGRDKRLTDGVEVSVLPVRAGPRARRDRPSCCKGGTTHERPRGLVVSQSRNEVPYADELVDAHVVVAVPVRKAVMPERPGRSRLAGSRQPGRGVARARPFLRRLSSTGMPDFLFVDRAGQELGVSAAQEQNGSQDRLSSTRAAAGVCSR